MRDYRKDFASFDGRIWLNAASEGPLPLAAAASLKEAVEWKSKPYLLDNSKFVSAVKELKESIGRLLNVPEADVILANSASYGLHLLANGMRWQKADEILLMQNDFPTNILPWLALERKGVQVRQIKPKEKVLQPQELSEHISAKTRLFCISHVHTFTGFVLDIEKFAQICREKNVLFVVNCSQSAGTMPLDCSKLAVDAVVAAGYKWLCGPYGTGFCWIRPQLREALDLNQAYWVAMLSYEELHRAGPLTLKTLKTARKYDVFGTANFFNFVPFRSAIDYWLEIGLDKVRACHDRLLDRLIEGLKNSAYELISPEEGKFRSSLAVFSHKDRQKNPQIFRSLIDQKIYPALWKWNLRVAPHVYNTKDEIDTLLKALKKM